MRYESMSRGEGGGVMDEGGGVKEVWGGRGGVVGLVQIWIWIHRNIMDPAK